MKENEDLRSEISMLE